MEYVMMEIILQLVILMEVTVVDLMWTHFTVMSVNVTIKLMLKKVSPFQKQEQLKIESSKVNSHYFWKRTKTNPMKMFRKVTTDTKL